MDLMIQKKIVQAEVKMIKGSSDVLAADFQIAWIWN